MTSNSSGGEYKVWAIFEGIPTRFFVHESPGGGLPITTDFTLQNDPSMGCKMTLYAEDCQGEIVESNDYSLGSLSQIYTSILDQADPSYPPQLGEDILIKTTGNGKSDYRVRLKYELSGQTQYQIVKDVKCDSQDETWITLWSNSGLAYKTVIIESLRDGNIIGSLPFTIFP